MVFMKILLNATSKTQMIISQNMMEKDMISETQTLEKYNTVPILIYLCILEGIWDPYHK